MAGKGGFKPMPLAERLDTGNQGHRTKEQLNISQPTPEPVYIPEPPDCLISEIAQNEWRKLAPMLYRNLLFTEVDEEQLILFCNAWATYIMLEQEWERDPRSVVETTNGTPMTNPLLKAKLAAAAEVHKYLREFGMSPSSRMKVAVSRKETEKKHGKDALARLKEQREKINNQVLSGAINITNQDYES